MTLERLVAAIVGTLLLVAAHRCAVRAHRDLSAPVDVPTLYLAAWGAVLVLFAVPLIDYTLTPLVAWAAIYGAIVSGAVAAILVLRRPHFPIATVADRAQQLKSAIDARWLRIAWAGCAVLGTLGLLAFVYAVSRVLPWTAVLDDPAAVRLAKSDSTEFQDAYGIWKLLTYFNQVAFVLWTIGLRVGAFSGRWRWVCLAGAGSLLPFLVTADRGLLVATVAWAGMLHLIWPQRIALRRAVALVVTSVLVAGLAVTVIGNRYGGSLANHPDIAASLTTRAADPIAIPYLYLTANIPTFGRLTQDELAPLNLGGMTLLPFAKLSALTGVTDAAPVGTGVFYPIPFQDFSNYSWLGSFWLDLRLLGALLLPALTLAIAAWAHRRTTTRPSLGMIWLTSVLLYVIVFSPFANAFSATVTWQFLLLTPLVAFAVDARARSRTWARVATSGACTGVAVGTTLMIACAVTAVGLVREPGRATAGPTVTADPSRVLAEAIVKVESIYGELGEYPSADNVADRLHVNQPRVTFTALPAISDEVTKTDVVWVFASPQDVFLRVRGRDGRLYEAHRTEDWGGRTFGPGTRDE